MKRSRIFLGATTALLAIAGIAAAKAHKAPFLVQYYYTVLTSPSLTHVKPGPITYNYVSAASGGDITKRLTISFNGGHYKAYTDASALIPTYYKAD